MNAPGISDEWLLWATEEEIRDRFRMTTIAPHSMRLHHRVLVARARHHGIPENEARAMTCAELVRTLEGQDPRD
jgi:hypothetical protein